MNIGFTRHKEGSIVYYSIDAFTKTKLVRAGMSTRLGGVSTGETATLNLGFNKKDTRENVIKNYDIICSALGIDYKKLVLSNQVHENKVRIISSDDCGKGITKESDIIGIDAFVCGEKNVPFVIFCADCVPVFFLDTKKGVAALAHSGWRSTVKNISCEVIKTMEDSFGCKTSDIICAIGPSIGQCCFEVDNDVAQMFDSHFSEKRAEKYNIDLWGVIFSQLSDAGISEHNITLANICTCCKGDEFFSNRAHKGKIGLMGAFMELI